MRQDVRSRGDVITSVVMPTRKGGGNFPVLTSRGRVRSPTEVVATSNSAWVYVMLRELSRHCSGGRRILRVEMNLASGARVVG